MGSSTQRQVMAERWSGTGKKVVIKTLAEYSAEAGNGLRCPKCNCADLRTSYRKPLPNGFRRIRFCRSCGHRIETTEHISGSGDQ
jgi:hypothetical protein